MLRNLSNKLKFQINGFNRGLASASIKVPENTADDFDGYIKALNVAAKKTIQRYPYSMGYPLNLHKVKELEAVDEAIKSAGFDILNNVLDPFDHESSHWKHHSLEQEKRLVIHFLKSFGADLNTSYGFLQPDSTIAILKGIEFAKEKFADEKSVVIYSDQAHFCIKKIVRYLGSLEACIKSEVTGEMSMDAFSNSIDTLINYMHIKRFILVPSYGTTFYGATDDLYKMMDIMQEFDIPREHIHVHLDGALAGAYMNNKQSQVYSMGTDFDSINISQAKWYGGWISGLILISDQGKSVVKPDSSVSYLQFTDRMVSGSRDGFAAPRWLARLYQFDWQKVFDKCVSNTLYLQKRLANDLKIPSFSHKEGITVVFPKPSVTILNRFQLATENDFCHVICMQHVNKKLIDIFIEELKQSGGSQEN